MEGGGGDTDGGAGSDSDVRGGGSGEPQADLRAEGPRSALEPVPLSAERVVPLSADDGGIGGNCTGLKLFDGASISAVDVYQAVRAARSACSSHPLARGAPDHIVFGTLHDQRYIA